jgi:hypothetical protein
MPDMKLCESKHKLTLMIFEVKAQFAKRLMDAKGFRSMDFFVLCR